MCLHLDNFRPQPPPRPLSLEASSQRGPRPQAVATEVKKLERAAVPLELEDGELPLNTFSPKKPFTARIGSRLASRAAMRQAMRSDPTAS